VSLSTLERAIWHEAQVVTGRKSLRLKDLLEWSTSEIAGRDGEVVVYLPGNKVWAAFPQVAGDAQSKA